MGGQFVYVTLYLSEEAVPMRLAFWANVFCYWLKYHNSYQYRGLVYAKPFDEYFIYFTLFYFHNNPVRLVLSSDFTDEVVKAGKY